MPTQRHYREHTYFKPRTKPFIGADPSPYSEKESKFENGQMAHHTLVSLLLFLFGIITVALKALINYVVTLIYKVSDTNYTTKN